MASNSNICQKPHLIVDPERSADGSDGEGRPHDGPGHGEVGYHLAARGGSLKHYDLIPPVPPLRLLHGTNHSEVFHSLGGEALSTHIRTEIGE